MRQNPAGCAQQANDEVFRRYHDTVFERFWQRALDIENPEVLAAILIEAGADGASFPAQAAALQQQVAAISRAAEAQGVFGVTSFVLDGELYWGREHIEDIRELLAAG